MKLYKNKIKCAECNQKHDIRNHKKIVSRISKMYTTYKKRKYAIYEKTYSIKIKKTY